jgi:hypothetical protein
MTSRPFDWNWRNLKMWLLVIAAVLNLALWGLSYQNRASEKIVTTLIAALVGALATSVAVIVFSGAPPVSERFVTSLPVSFDNQTLRLVRLPGIDRESRIAERVLMRANEAITTLQGTGSSLFSIPYDEFGQTLFHHLLQRALLEWMAQTYDASWRIERLSSERWEPMAGSSDTASTLIRPEEFSKFLQGNQFANLQLSVGSLRQLALPPKMKISMEPPTNFPGSKSTIRIRNSFCSVVIEINSSVASLGLGPLARFGQPGEWLPSTRVTVTGGASALDFEPVNGRLGLVSYKISATASFSAFYSGHPEMPAYKTWVNELFASLRQDWDDEVLMRKAIERLRDEQVFARSPKN